MNEPGIGATEPHGTRVGRLLGRSAIVGAWFFVFSSVFAICWELWPFTVKPGVATVFHTTSPSGDHYSFGLVYRGAPGLALGIGQLACVVLASVVSLSRFGAVRRLGLLALLAWNGLWLADGVQMFLADHLRLWIVVTTGLSLLLVCTVARTVLRWDQPDARLAVRPATA